MPVYKTCEQYLRDAIASVLTQTYTNFEFLIVNDSPEDALRLERIISSYKDDRIVWISGNRHSGIAVASNIGISRAKGEFVAMIDHDDICVQNRFALQIKFLKDHPEIGFVGGQALGFYSDQDNIRLNYALTSSVSELKQSFFDGVPFLNPSVMFRKAILDIAKYNPNYKVCADYELFARLVFKHGIIGANLSDIILYYRFHDANLSLTEYLLAEQETNQVQSWIVEQEKHFA